MGVHGASSAGRGNPTMGPPALPPSPHTAPAAAPPAAAPDQVTLGAAPATTVDLRRAAQLVLARQGTGVEKQWAVSGTSSGSPVRGPRGEIYLSRSQRPEVISVDPSDGHVLWSVTPGGGHRTSPLLLADGTLLVGGQDGAMHALRPTDGHELWSVPVPGGLGYTFMGPDGLVYTAADGNLSGIDPTRRAVVTETPLEHDFEAAPAVGRDGTVYGGGHDGDLYALEPGSGRVKWHQPSGGMLRNSPAIASDGTIYAGCIGMAVVAFDPADGHEKWRFPAPHWILPSPIVMSDGTVLAGCSNHTLYAIDPATGRERWHFDMNGEVRVEPALGADGVIYAVSDRNTLYGLDARTGEKRWSAPAPSYVHCPLAPDSRGGFVFGSNDDTLVAMRDPETARNVTLMEAIEKVPAQPAPVPTLELHDGWIVVDGVRVPVRPR